MSATFIVAYVLFYILAIVGAIYLYTFTIYTKNRVFKKQKSFDFTILFFALLWVFSLTLGILFATTFKSKGTIPHIPTHIGLCFGLLGIDSIYIILYCVLLKVYTKNKVDYTNINIEDIKARLEKAKSEIGNIETCKDLLAKKHKKYYQSMMMQYKIIVERTKDVTLSKSQKLADVVLFDETFTNKWSNKINLYKKVLSLEYLALI